jgi:hypothetical protein
MRGDYPDRYDQWLAEVVEVLVAGDKTKGRRLLSGFCSQAPTS